MHGKGILVQKMMCKKTVWRIASALLLMSVLCVQTNAADPPGDVDDPRFQMLAIAGRAMLLDRETGKSWLLAARGEKAAWIPIQKLGSSSVASNWLKANLPERKSSNGGKKPSARTQALRQVAIEQVAGEKASSEPYEVLIARARAELTRLKREYGDQHPDVVASRTRLVQLLRLGRN